MLCNMDKKKIRLFSIQYQEVTKNSEGEVVKPSFSYVIMQSRIDGEYGTIVFQVTAQIDCLDSQLICGFISTSGETLASLTLIRHEELSFFLHQILPLFRVETLITDEVPFTSSFPEAKI